MDQIGDVFKPLLSIPGKVSVVYKNLNSGETFCYKENLVHRGASIIKLYVMGEAFRQMEVGILERDRVFTLRDEDRVPPCGVLTFMHEGLKVNTADLLYLMIILSDNVAANLLIDALGIENINRFIRESGLTLTVLRRKMFDRKSAAEGNENMITAKETGLFLEKLYKGEVVSPHGDRKMLAILKRQQLNNKFPLLLEEDEVEIAHKTGEDDGISHDAGIFYTKEPFLLVVLGNDLEDLSINSKMGEVAEKLTKIHN